MIPVLVFLDSGFFSVPEQNKLSNRITGRSCKSKFIFCFLLALLVSDSAYAQAVCLLCGHPFENGRCTNENCGFVPLVNVPGQPPATGGREISGGPSGGGLMLVPMVSQHAASQKTVRLPGGNRLSVPGAKSFLVRSHWKTVLGDREIQESVLESYSVLKVFAGCDYGFGDSCFSMEDLKKFWGQDEIEIPSFENQFFFGLRKDDETLLFVINIGEVGPDPQGYRPFRQGAATSISIEFASFLNTPPLHLQVPASSNVAFIVLKLILDAIKDVAQLQTANVTVFGFTGFIENDEENEYFLFSWD